MELFQGSSSSSSKCLSNREIEVCKILLNLKKIIRQFDTIPPNLHWVVTKPRSLLHFTPNPNPLRHIYYSPEEGESKPTREGRSPTTPLSFSDDDQKSHRKISKKRTREDMLEQIERLEQNRTMLREALEKVENHHRNLMALNLELKKTKKQKLQLPPLENQSHPQLDNMNKDQPSNTDSNDQTTQVNTFIRNSCNEMSIKPFREFDLNELPPLDDCEMEWSQP